MALTLRASPTCHIPILGLGTWRSPRGSVGQAVITALETGYRHIDCAYLYGNEQEIGAALQSSLHPLNLERTDLFIVSKLWSTHFRPELVRQCCEESLHCLGLAYLDLYLMHCPAAFKPGGSLFPLESDGKTIALDNVPLLDTWKAMEDLVDAGLVKAIGVSNFNRRQLDLILKHCRIRPVNLQVEVHANFPNIELVEYAQSVGVTVTAYAPLGSPGGFRGKTNLLTEQWVSDIAQKYGKTNAQVLLRYLVQRGLAVIPKSIKPARIRENAQIFDFELSPEDMHQLNTRGQNQRQFRFEKWSHHPEHPFVDEQ